jgi:DNA repair protein RadC
MDARKFLNIEVLDHLVIGDVGMVREFAGIKHKIASAAGK